MDIDMLKRVVCEAITTRSDELTCFECYELLDEYAEVILVGQDAASPLTHVHDHLERYADCREEWTGLLASLRALSRDSSSPTITGHPCEQEHPCTKQKGTHNA